MEICSGATLLHTILLQGRSWTMLSVCSLHSHQVYLKSPLGSIVAWVWQTPWPGDALQAAATCLTLVDGSLPCCLIGREVTELPPGHDDMQLPCLCTHVDGDPLPFLILCRNCTETNMPHVFTRHDQGVGFACSNTPHTCLVLCSGLVFIMSCNEKEMKYFLHIL